MDLHLLIVVGLVIIVCILGALLAQTRARAGAASRSRNARALAGEVNAENLLEELGFQIRGRQVAFPGTVWIDDEPMDFGIRVDLVLERDGQAYVAEVKTGDLAPDPRHGPTRRQLREYAALLPDHGVLLVDMEAGQVHEVEF